MAKIRILFLIKDFKHGGIPRVLINLINCLNCREFDIDVFVSNPVGVFEKQCMNCNILPHNEVLRLICCNYRLLHGWEYLKSLMIKNVRKFLQIFFKLDILDSLSKKIGKKFSYKYDVVWACSEETPAKIAQNIMTNKRIIWIHNDYQVCYEMIKKIGMPNFALYDKIICVAKHGAVSFIESMRNKLSLDLADKVEVLYNIVNYNEIYFMSKKLPKQFEFDKNTFNIVSVGRIAWEKQYEIIPFIISNLKFVNIKFKWYIIGDGTPEMKEIIMKEVRRYHVEDKLFMLGVKENPYPYISQANLMVMTSRYETYPTVISEARVLGTPIICIDFKGASECLPHDDGIICRKEEISTKIYDIMLNKNLARHPNIECFENQNQDVIRRFVSIVS